MTISLQFLGAARNVTGSKHLLTVNDRKLLLDCGMVQGPRRLSNKLNRELGLDASSLDAVVLSHAHVDHSGSLPRLVRLGYRGPIHCTEATHDLLEILLPDSAHLQASDARYLAKRGKAVEPAYAMEDVEQTLRQTEPVAYERVVQICPEVRATFLEAGHILGSAQVVLDVNDGTTQLRLAFTGDLGRKGLPILRDPAPLPKCDVLITESTYGDRLHPMQVDLKSQIRDFFTEQQHFGGRVVIPAFSVGRTQNLLWYLGQLMRAGEIPELPIFVDSPLSSKATSITAKHPELYDRETQALFRSGHNPFFFKGVQTTASVEESKALNTLTSGIIISASGMCEGGRILHHLMHTLTRPEDCVLIVGFQAASTLGRRLLEGYPFVKIFGVRYQVRCRVRHINGLSAHADANELLQHHAPLASGLRQTFVVHGEERASCQFADRLEAAGFQNVEVPLHKETYLLAT